MSDDPIIEMGDLALIETIFDACKEGRHQECSGMSETLEAEPVPVCGCDCHFIDGKDGLGQEVP
jgi:hypothetical protein